MSKTRILFATAAILIATCVFDAGAALNDCGQPASNGSMPTASDALYTLRAGVGAALCDITVCDVDSNCVVSATDALILLRAATGQGGELSCAAGCLGSTTSTTTTTTVPAATWTEVQAVLVANGCAVGGCHGSGNGSGGLGNLNSYDQGYAELTGPGVGCLGSGFDARVVPGDPDSSFLIAKLTGLQDCGSPMPPAGAPMSAGDIDAVISWIASGAPKN